MPISCFIQLAVGMGVVTVCVLPDVKLAIYLEETFDPFRGKGESVSMTAAHGSYEHMSSIIEL